MPLWLADRPLVLASRSAVRNRILFDAGVTVETVPADIDERSVEEHVADQDAGEIAALLAREKAYAVAGRMPGRWVLGADQLLIFGEQRFSKPTNRSAAAAQLRTMRGQTHDLISAIALVRDSDVVFEHRERARLTMRAFTDAFLEEYLDRIGPAVTASVGGYQLEKSGIQLFERIEGDHFVILGLPLLALLKFLRERELLAR